MSLAPKIKDPDEVLDYVFDWAPLTNARPGARSDWLGSGETIVTRTVTAAAGITVDSTAITDTATSVTVWLSGGTAGVDYDVACRVVTSANRTGERTLSIMCRQR